MRETLVPGLRCLCLSLKIGRGRVQIRIALAFLLLAAVPGVAGGPATMALFAMLLAASLLAHELGHVVCGLTWGSRVVVTLHALGAHTTAEPRLARRRQFVATLIGPVTSIAIGLLLARLHRAFPATGSRFKTPHARLIRMRISYSKQHALCCRRTVPGAAPGHARGRSFALETHCQCGLGSGGVG